MGDFKGFSKDGLSFLKRLERNNTKAFFDQHRQAYDEGIVEPAKAFVVELAEALSKTVPGIVAEPRVNGSLFRIHRDVRFSKDKTPYKTHQALFLWEGETKKTSHGFYMQIEPDNVMLGVGGMGMPNLDRWRAAIDDETSGKAFERALAQAEKKLGALSYPEPALKRVPKPYDADHPRAEWLKLKWFNAGVTEKAPKSITTSKFVGWCARRFESFAPVHRWLVEHAQ